MKKMELNIDNMYVADTAQMMEWIEGFTCLPHRKTGTPEGRMSADYVKKIFTEIGLDNVEEELIPSVCPDYRKYELIAGGLPVECFFVNGSNRRAKKGDFDTDIKSAEIVYIGKGSVEDFEGLDVSGKIVLSDVYFKTQHPHELLHWMDDAEMYDPRGKTDKPIKKYDIYTPNNWPYNYMTAMEKGAAGFVGILHNFMDCNYYHEDYADIIEMDGYMEIPGVWISHSDGEKLKEQLSSGKLTADLHVHTVFEEKNAIVLKGEIKGELDDIIVVHSHHDAVCSGAVQDASGMSVVFAIADFFKKNMITPSKTLMFVSTDSHYTDYEGHVGFLENRKEAGDNIILDFAIEHIAEEMDMDDENNIVLTGENETRMMYITDKDGLFELAREAVKKYDLEKTVLFPVRTRSEGAYTNDDVCSDAYDFSAAGIPVVSILSAPMYLFHNTDTIDKVHKPSLEKVLYVYLYMILKLL